MSNQWHGFVGNLTRDPELRSVARKDGSGTISVASFSVAVNGRDKEVTFFECEAWAKSADIIAKWFHKGESIAILDAEARNDTWTDKTTNEKRSKLKFRVNRFGFLGGIKNSEGDDQVIETEAGEAKPEKKKVKPKTKPEPVEEEEEDGDIPF